MASLADFFTGDDNLAKVLIPAVTAAIAIYNWRVGRFRSKLKDDLDILLRYRNEFIDDSADPSNDICYKHLRDRIQRRMHKAYVLRRTDKSDILSGVILVIVAIAPWIPLFKDWSSALRVGLSVAAASLGLAFLYAGIKDYNEPRKIKGLPDTFDYDTTRR